MKKLLFILAVVFIAGGAVWWFMLRAPAAQELPHEDLAPAAKFIALDPLTVPVVRDGALQEVMRLELTVEVPSPAAEEEVRRALPRLNDAYVVELYALLARRQMQQSSYDTATIKRRLQVASERVLGTGMVSAVLVGRIAIAQTR